MQYTIIKKSRKLTIIVQSAIILMCIIFILYLPAQAAQKSKGSKKGPKPIGLVNSSNGGVFKKGQYGIISKYIQYTQDQLYDGNDKVDFERPKKGKKAYEKSFLKYQLTIRTGLAKNLDARLIIPFLDKELKRKSAKKDFQDSNSGIGDIKLISRYQIWSQKNNDPFNLAIGAGIELPTGQTDYQDKQNKYPGFLQTGSGSYDPILEVGAHTIRGRHWFSGHLMYKLTTQGELGNQDFEKPDIFKYNLGYAYALSKLFDLQLELNGQLKSKAKLEGTKKDNTGGHMLYLTPGVHFKFHKGMHLDLCTPIPVYRDLNSEHVSEDYRIVAKLAFKF